MGLWLKLPCRVRDRRKRVMSYKIYAFVDEVAASIDKQIEAMKRNGLAGLEIRCVDGVNVSELPLDRAKEIKKKLDDNGLVTWSLGSPIGKINIETDDFAAHIEKLKHTLEVGNILDTRNIRLFSFYTPEGKNVADYKNEVIDRVGKMCEITAQYGIFACHENEKGIYGDIPERCLELHQAIPALKGIFDPANFVQCGVDTLKAWDMLQNYIYYMHIKDALINGTVVPSGAGNGNVGAIAKKYLEMGNFAFTIEPHLAVFEGFADLEKEGESIKLDEYQYKSNDEAFDVACNAFKNVIGR